MFFKKNKNKNPEIKKKAQEFLVFYRMPKGFQPIFSLFSRMESTPRTFKKN
jgi:hypothetical protein